MDTFQKLELQKRYPDAWWDLNPDTFSLTADDLFRAYRSEDLAYFDFITSYSKEIAELRESPGNEPSEYWVNVMALGQWIYLHLNELRRNGCLYHPCYDGESPYLQAILSAIFTAIKKGNGAFIKKFKDKEGNDLDGWLRDHEQAWIEVSGLGICSPLLIAVFLEKYRLANSLLRQFYHLDDLMSEIIFLMGMPNGEKSLSWILRKTSACKSPVICEAHDLARSLWYTRKKLKEVEAAYERVKQAQHHR